jgi:DNA-binding transcriptional ArsR family regulator
VDHLAVGFQRDGARGRPEPARAFVLKSLLMPRTTTELAQELGLSLAAVSAHLSRLKVGGLAKPHRSGKSVCYRLSFAGESLLEIFSETD